MLLLFATLAFADPTVEELLVIPKPAAAVEAQRLKYLDRLRQHVDIPWRSGTERLQQIARITGDHEVVVELSIGADGGVHDLRLVRSSGVPALDQMAIDVYNGAAPLPLPPAALLTDERFHPGPQVLRMRATPPDVRPPSPYAPGNDPDAPASFPGIEREGNEDWPSR